MEFLVAAQVACALILAMSGRAKLRAPHDSARAFAALKPPRWLSDPRVPRILPWVEVVLALSIALGLGAFLAVAGVIAAGLFLAYFLLALRALQFDEPVRAAWVGERAGQVSPRTLIRLGGSVALSLLVVLAGAGRGVWGLTLTGWGWLAVSALAAWVLWLTFGAGGAGRGLGFVAKATVFDARQRQAVRVRDLAGVTDGAVLLFLEPDSSQCDRVIERREEWVGRPVVPIVPGGESANEKFAWLPRLHEDPGFNLPAALGATPPVALRVDRLGQPVGELVQGVKPVLAALAEAPSSAVGVGAAVEFRRRPIPPAVVLTADRAVLTLTELATGRAQLLVGINRLSSATLAVLGRVEAWQQEVRGVDVRVIAPFDLVEGVVASGVRRTAVYDHQRVASEALGLRGDPSAVFLGSDGVILGEPVSGAEQIEALVSRVATSV